MASGKADEKRSLNEKVAQKRTLIADGESTLSTKAQETSYYRVKNINLENRIGLSKLTPSMSYDRVGLKTTLNPSNNFQ